MKYKREATASRFYFMELLQFSSLRTIPGFRHAVTTRSGGVSTGDFFSLNLAFHVGDNEEAVQENRRQLALEAGYDANALVAAQQVHGDQVTLITERNSGKGAWNWASAISDTDALITAQTGLPLLILVADCAPILLVDPDKRVLAVVHAGWRGAVARIASKAVERMSDVFGTLPESIMVGIGPCLCTENLEVGFEVAELISAVDASAVVQGVEKPQLDLRRLIQSDLQSVGVAAQNIETMPWCSKDDKRFFSHRGQNGKAGRFGIVAWWEHI